MTKGRKQLSEKVYSNVCKVLEKSISGPFRITDVVRRSGLDFSTVNTALRRLRKENKVLSYRKSGRYTLYIKASEAPQMEDRKFKRITQKVRKSLGDSEFTPALIARSLDISFDEAHHWFNQAVQDGMLEQSRNGSRWARMRSELKSSS